MNRLTCKSSRSLNAPPDLRRCNQYMRTEHTKHITLNSDDNEMVSIDVDDWELFDVVEDYLIEECDIENEYMKELSIDGSQIYRMYF